MAISDNNNVFNIINRSIEITKYYKSKKYDYNQIIKQLKIL